MLDPEATGFVAAELRKIAHQMRSNTEQAPNPNRLKSLNRSCRNEAASFLSGVFQCYPNWQIVLEQLLKQQHCTQSELDEPASMVVTEYDSTPVVLADGSEHYRPIRDMRVPEHQIPEDKRDQHYVDQAVRWAQLIDNAATMIEADVDLLAASRLTEQASVAASGIEQDWAQSITGHQDNGRLPREQIIQQQLAKLSQEASRLLAVMLKFGYSGEDNFSYEQLFEKDRGAFRTRPNGNTKKRMVALRKLVDSQKFDFVAIDSGWRWVKRP